MAAEAKALGERCTARRPERSPGGESGPAGGWARGRSPLLGRRGCGLVMAMVLGGGAGCRGWYVMEEEVEEDEVEVLGFIYLSWSQFEYAIGSEVLILSGP